MSRPLSIYVVAAERSGDLLGASLIQSLRDQAGEATKFAGIGGAAMAKEGISSPFDISQLSIFGFVDGLKAYSRVKARVADALDDIFKHEPDVVVLIDSWGFTLRVAQGVRAARPDIKLVKYVGPQVFGSRPGRAKTLAASVDHLLSILNFDAPYYEAHGLPVTFVGNPTLERLDRGDGAAFRARHKISDADKLLIVLPGSRPSEIKRLFESFADAVERLGQTQSGLTMVMALADPIRDMARARIDKDARFADVVVIDEDEKADAFEAADVALACSGTVVTELATAGVPTIAAYRLGWITWGLIRVFNLLKTRFISLVNIAADEELVPEYVQTRCTGRLLSREVEALLNAPDRRLEIQTRLRETTAIMRGSGEASQRAAEVVLQVVAQ
jgi:lipid-A-disaccharide synthase